MSSSAVPAFTPEYLASDKGPRILTILIVFPVFGSFDRWTQAVHTTRGSSQVIIRGLDHRISVGMTDENVLYSNKLINVIQIFSIATSMCQGYEAKNGMGRHIQVLTPGQGIRPLKALFASIMMYNFGLTLTKASIVLQYMRISIGHNLRRREKYTLALILGPGGFASIASILRLNTLHELQSTRDISWDNPGTATWSVIEMNLGIICASLPTLREIIIHHLPRVFRSTWVAAPSANIEHQTGGGSGGTAESDSSQLVYVSTGRHSAATDVHDPFSYMDIGKSTFYPSDSEQGYVRNDWVSMTIAQLILTGRS
ncbi:hypothetical protein P171DRAFT_483617 [Karstenula rhodostoma CBS 690.94]|uniref:Rhodopsin domain-containing protein n=1 Tax=Karstenula rhodostoma CBS 690.94 TaxID=1392251 RepID=A0A9P4PJK1_9PLEO|nr:hypothetical protein P171DRAFT_483617 [Karstenula rhodostoma CBS 690.94]